MSTKANEEDTYEDRRIHKEEIETGKIINEVAGSSPKKKTMGGTSRKKQVAMTIR